MTRAQRFQNGGSRITPRAPAEEAATGDRFLVLIEGSQTERRYLDELCGTLRLTAETVIIDSPESDPLRLVNEAIVRRERRRKEAKERTTVEYNQIWVVCDRERQHHHRFDRLREACQLARLENIYIALSIPTFEFWLLLHHNKHSGILPDCPDAVAMLTKVQNSGGHPNYDKGTYPLRFYVTADQVRAACARARQLRQQHASADSVTPPRYWTQEYVLQFAGANQPNGNPCSDVDELVRQFNHAAHPRFRCLTYADLPVVPFSVPKLLSA